LRNAGYQVNALDLNIELYKIVKDEHKKLWNLPNPKEFYPKHFHNLKFITEDIYENFAKRILSFNSEIIGFNVNMTSVEFVRKIIQKIKSLDNSRIIILGGPEVYRFYGEDEKMKISTTSLDNLANIFVVGEGEETLLNVIRNIEQYGEVKNCPGAIVKKNNKLIDFGDRKPIENIDQIPFPDFSDFNLNDYKNVGFLPIMGSRGCFGRCEFCYERVFWKKYRYRTAENIFQEMKRDIEMCKAKYLFFVDSVFNGNLNELEKLCDLIIDNKLNIKWVVKGARINMGMSESLFTKMKMAGCEHISYGIESGSQKILDLIKKDMKIEDAEKIIRLTKKSGITIHCSFIIGFPGETDEDFQKTLDFVEENEKFISMVEFIPYFYFFYVYKDGLNDYSKDFSEINKDISLCFLKSINRKDLLDIKKRFELIIQKILCGKNYYIRVPSIDVIMDSLNKI
jgi:radical SAM superfamily enzyme YgiQ (UPF0313 family)